MTKNKKRVERNINHTFKNLCIFCLEGLSKRLGQALLSKQEWCHQRLCNWKSTSRNLQTLLEYTETMYVLCMNYYVNIFSMSTQCLHCLACIIYQGFLTFCLYFYLEMIFLGCNIEIYVFSIFQDDMQIWKFILIIDFFGWKSKQTSYWSKTIFLSPFASGKRK